MATADFTPVPTNSTPSSTTNTRETAAPAIRIPQDRGNKQPLHRLRKVRLEQGMSLRSAARHLGSDVRTLREQEQEFPDLKLSDLHKWQKALDVPLVDLLEENDASLSRPVLERAKMLRLMKTAMAIHAQADSVGLQRMAQMMVDQLVEIMPELSEVTAWHTFGQRRGLEEFGRVVERRISEDALGGWDD